MQTALPSLDLPRRLRISEWPASEQPAHKLSYHGAEGLADAELLSLLIPDQPELPDPISFSVQLLGAHGGLDGLSRLSLFELEQIHGIGPRTAAKIKSSLELGRRALLAGAALERRQVRSAHDVACYLEHLLRGLAQEELHVVILTIRNHILKTHRVYKGNLTCSIVRPAEVFTEAIRCGASSIIVAHNHPSGDPSPSGDDVRVTRDLVAAGKLLDIDVLDHIVIGDARHGYVSLRERKLGFD